MIDTDEAALECDLAEVYHIYNYRELTPDRVALFSIGLRENSRIKLKLSGQEYPLDTILLACAVDRLSLLLWSKTKDAESGRNKPMSFVEQLLGEKEEKDFEVFDSPEAFEEAMKLLNKNGGK